MALQELFRRDTCTEREISSLSFYHLCSLRVTDIWDSISLKIPSVSV